uniref:Uncharacterized protein n=1 Tax=Glossina palpalis gambiensis TaxID=67801 RepID=A0A1B0B247_9MUSC
MGPKHFHVRNKTTYLLDYFLIISNDYIEYRNYSLVNIRYLNPCVFEEAFIFSNNTNHVSRGKDHVSTKRRSLRSLYPGKHCNFLMISVAESRLRDVAEHFAVIVTCTCYVQIPSALCVLFYYDYLDLVLFSNWYKTMANKTRMTFNWIFESLAVILKETADLFVHMFAIWCGTIVFHSGNMFRRNCLYSFMLKRISGALFVFYDNRFAIQNEIYIFTEVYPENLKALAKVSRSSMLSVSGGDKSIFNNTSSSCANAFDISLATTKY